MFSFTVFRLLKNVFLRVSGCPFFEFFELFLNSEFLTVNFLGYSIYDCPFVRFPLCVIKYYFDSLKGNLNNRPCHQVTVGPNWS